jgi:O-antigen/teichoic acid export membrane protein
MMSAFMTRTAIAVIVLGAVCAAAWLYAPRQHFVGVSAVCYGFLIGWFVAWYSVYRYSRRHPG